MANQAEIKADHIVDAKGLACPMPIVRTKKAMDQLEAGQVMEVQATDKGSLADIQGWSKNTGHQYIGTIEEGDVLKHYLRKSSPNEVIEERKYAHTISNKELIQKLGTDETITIVDVREPAEYAFNHIPGAKSIPLGELESRVDELRPDEELYVICRSGTRSDMASQLLADKGFKHVKNVIEGMSAWTGSTETN
ncbi:MAG: sulfurtransferase TusA family protein [Candidatus Pristimantibacillus sp.]